MLDGGRNLEAEIDTLKAAMQLCMSKIADLEEILKLLINKLEGNQNGRDQTKTETD